MREIAGTVRVTGNASDNLIHGRIPGDDDLRGGADDDTLDGGTGIDRFVFTAISQSPVGAMRDQIIGFDGVGGTAAGERVDLSAIGARPTIAGDQRFVFIGTAAFATAGQVRVVNLGASTLVQADVNGDGVADLEVEVNDGPAVARNWNALDFILYAGTSRRGVSIRRHNCLCSQQAPLFAHTFIVGVFNSLLEAVDRAPSAR